MSGAAWALLALQGVLFLAWAVTAFRLLFRLRARAAARSGSTFPGPGTALSEMHRFATSGGDRRDRRLLVALTAAMVLSILLRMILLTAA